MKAKGAFHLSFNARVGERFVPYLRKKLREARGAMEGELEELSIALVNEREMSRLHKQFMNIDGPTDVLTFPLDVNDEGAATSGEIVICVPHARRAAAENGVKLEQELLLYAIHGMLHLGGLDDRTAAQYNRMHRMEDEILEKLGVGAVFHPSRLPDRARGER